MSCHLTAVARSAASRRDSLLKSPEAYLSSRHDLTATANFANPQMVRALGYRNTELVLSPRVVHESAAVAVLADAALHSH